MLIRDFSWLYYLSWNTHTKFGPSEARGLILNLGHTLWTTEKDAEEGSLYFCLLALTLADTIIYPMAEAFLC